MFHQSPIAFVFHLWWQLPVLRGGECVGFGRERERAHTLQLRPAQKVEQLLKLAFGFARIADDERRAQRNVGHRRTQRLDHAPCDVGRRPTHPPQHARRAVLQRHIEVVNDLRMARHCLR